VVKGLRKRKLPAQTAVPPLGPSGLGTLHGFARALVREDGSECHAQ
jgi:hypothetical protein